MVLRRLRTNEGWLVLFHGVKATAAGSLYRAGLALLDLDHPATVLARSDEWVFGPEAVYERTGDVPGVVFPTGWIADDVGNVRIYYRAADTCAAVASARIDDLVGFATPTASRTLGSCRPLDPSRTTQG